MPLRIVPTLNCNRGLHSEENTVNKEIAVCSTDHEICENISPGMRSEIQIRKIKYPRN